MWGTNKNISFQVHSMSNYLIMENNHMPYFLNDFQNVLLILSRLSESTQPHARISSQSCFHPSSFSLPYPTNSDRLGLCLPHEWINIFISTLSQFSIKDEYSFSRPLWGAVNHRAPAGPFSSTCVCHSFYDHTSLQGMLKKTYTNTYNICNKNLLY